MSTKPPPKVLPHPDWTALQELVEEHIANIATGDDDEDDVHHLYEALVEAVYGPDIWEKWMNPILMKR